MDWIGLDGWGCGGAVVGIAGGRKGEWKDYFY